MNANNRINSLFIDKQKNNLVIQNYHIIEEIVTTLKITKSETEYQR